MLLWALLCILFETGISFNPEEADISGDIGARTLIEQYFKTDCPVESPYNFGFQKCQQIAYSLHSTCKYSEFTCLSSQCIKRSQVCDGKVHCDDGSDEVQSLCLDISCPFGYSPCSYGACILKSKKCNGVKDCYDGSDEEEHFCLTYKPESQTETPEDAPDEPLMDIYEDDSETDCDDINGSCYPEGDNMAEVSDEHLISTVGSSPANLTYKYNCLSGHIIDESLLCDGNSDCNDGSDETIAQCTGIRCPGYLYQCAYGGCIERDKRCNGEDDCKDGSDEDKDLCEKEKPHIPLMFCPKLLSDTVEFTCFHLGKEIDCSLPAQPGTVVKAKCKPAYHMKKQPDGFGETICLLGGRWKRVLFSCEPDCGERNSGRPLLWNSMEVFSNDFPWHAGIYKMFGQEYKCGGSIITVKAIITAAHCVYDYTGENDYVIAVGKIMRSWNVQEPNEQRFKVAEFILERGFRASDSLYGEDIAILALDKRIEIRTTVMPICFDRSPTTWNSNFALVVGWGLTQDNVLSNKLRMSRLPVYNADYCLKIVHPRFTRYITRDKFCGGFEGTTQGPRLAEGDSGGSVSQPRIVGKKELYFLTGVVSLSDRDDSSITLFTNVTEHILWINNVLSAIEKNKI